MPWAEQIEGYGPPTPVPIFQWEKEFVPLLEMYRQKRPRKVLEIGSYHGGTLYHWLSNAAPGAEIVSVDTYTAADNRHLYPEWTPSDVRLHVVQGDSRDEATVEQVRQWAPYDWVFIDAGHYYEEVRDDWLNYGAMGNGVVAFHDIITHRMHPEIQVERLWNELRATGSYEMHEIVDRTQTHFWGGIGVIQLHSDEYLHERWRQPVVPMKVATTETWASAETGRATLDFSARLRPEDVERIRLGYVCIQCWEPHQEAFPSRCSVCGFAIRERQPGEFQRLFRGEERDARAVTIERELDALEDRHERNFYTSKGGVIIPRAITN